MSKSSFVISLIIELLFARQSLGADVFYYTSSPTSLVGHGLTQMVTPSDGFAFEAFYFGGVVALDVKNDSSTDYQFWDLHFGGTSNQYIPTDLGLYTDAERWPFASLSGHNSLCFDGNYGEDNTLTGQFDILQAVLGGPGPNGTTYLENFAADFIQYDEGDLNAWNIGSIRINSDIPITLVPEPSTLALLALGSLGLLVRRRI